MSAEGRILADPVVVVGAARTPIGAFMGTLQTLSAHDLGAVAIRAAVARSGVSGSTIDEVVMGNVLMAGQGQAPARQAALAGGLPEATSCCTVNKMCGSGMKAVMLAHDLLVAGNCRAIVAGGMESMSNAPHLLLGVRQGLRLGHAQLKDHMLLDGLEDAYEPGKTMGLFAEACAERYGFSREAQDAYALTSLERALNADRDGSFATEIAPVCIRATREEVVVERDEQPFKARPERIPTLKPAFKADGTVTAANASSISDGAAALVLMRRSQMEALGLRPLATIVAHTEHAQSPRWFTTAPIGAIRALLARTGWSPRTVDLFEINEAFAVVAMAAMRELDIPHDRVNIHGGATALGHPIGASGARVLVTLLHALIRRGGRRGIAALCIGGGEATAVAIECPG